MCVCALTCTLSAPSACPPAFEILLQTGFDFLLDSSYKPWLLEVNASPSMAWDTPDQPGASQLMYSVKQQMLLDMFALLRLQDRYPAQQQQPDAAEGQPATPGSDKHPPRSPADEGLNPVLLQAASEAYFSSRPKVAAMVAADARQLEAAVAAAPARGEVEAGVALLLQQLETAPGSGSQQQQVAGVLRTHMRQLVQVECELRSGGGWQSLLPHVPSRRDAAKRAWRLHSSRADAAVASWLRLRSMVQVERVATQAV